MWNPDNDSCMCICLSSLYAFSCHAWQNTVNNDKQSHHVFVIILLYQNKFIVCFCVIDSFLRHDDTMIIAGNNNHDVGKGNDDYFKKKEHTQKKWKFNRFCGRPTWVDQYAINLQLRTDLTYTKWPVKRVLILCFISTTKYTHKIFYSLRPTSNIHVDIVILYNLCLHEMISN